MQLPFRFQDPENWELKVKKQHSLYTTTTNDYGKRLPTKFEMPDKYFSQSSKFSKSLTGAGPYRNYSLNTKMTK